MAREIEVKFCVDEPQQVRSTLASVGATPDGCVFERNFIYDTPGAALRGRGCAIRIRVERDLRDGAERGTLTFKGPREACEMKIREELETSVCDPDVLAQILSKLGLSVVVSYEKRRESWRLAGCEVVLDELPRLGWFLEIEGPSVDEVSNCQRMLALPDSNMTQESYVSLTAKHGDNRDGTSVLQF